MKSMILQRASAWGDSENFSIFNTTLNLDYPIEKVAEVRGKNAEDMAKLICMTPQVLTVLTRLEDFGKYTVECPICKRRDGMGAHFVTCPISIAKGILERLDIKEEERDDLKGEE